MKAKFTCIAVAVLAIAAFGATSASAATEFGDNCVANDSTESSAVTLFEVAAPGNPLPTAAPSAGVITKWKVNVLPVPVSFLQTLKVLRQNGPNTVQIVGEASQTVTGGLNTFGTRISVQAGDRLSLFGSAPGGTLVCEVAEAAIIGGFLGGGGGVGSTVPFVQEPAPVRIPVAAAVEPDADNDGFGDETQDGCPQLAAAQTACPVVTVDATARARKGSVSVFVTTTSQAPVTVAGTVKLGKGKTAKLNGGTQVVVPGAIAKFTLFFPEKLREKLKGLSTKQSLKLNVTATATDLIGRISSDKFSLKLKGQKKPPRKQGKGKG